MTKSTRPQPKTDRNPPQASVLAHPVFPVIAAVWFGALCGLGALAASGDALTGLVGHLHLAAILPAAAPPLGTTAHILIAIGLAGLGTVFGLVLALVLQGRATGVAPFAFARMKAGVIKAKSPKPAPEARDVVDDVPVDAPLPPILRVRNRDAHPDAPPRRPLVVTEDVLPYHAPIAVTEATTAGESPVVAPPVVGPVIAPPAWTATDFVESAISDHGHDHDVAPFGAFMTGHSPTQAPAPDAEVPPFFAGSFGDVPPLARSGVYSAGEPVILPPETGAHTQLAHAQPVVLPDATPESESVPETPVVHAGPVFHAGPMPLASQATVAPQVPIDTVPVDSLGLVQLIERLALAITVRQAHRQAQTDQQVPGDVFAHPVPASTEPLLRAKPSRLGRVDDAADVVRSDVAFNADTAVPVHLHDPLARVDASHHDWADTAELPPRFLGGNPSATTAQSDTSVYDAMVIAPEDDFVAPHSVFGALPDEPVETRYSSLVNMAMVRPDLTARAHDGLSSDAAQQSDPVVQFPVPAGDNAAPAPMRGGPTDQADRALRDALATLRRMSAQR